MNTQKGFASILLILLVLVVAGGVKTDLNNRDTDSDGLWDGLESEFK